METQGELADLAETVVAQLRLSDGATPFHVVLQPERMQPATRGLRAAIRPRRADGKLCWDVSVRYFAPFSSRDAEFVAAVATNAMRATETGVVVVMGNDNGDPELPLYIHKSGDEVDLAKLVKVLRWVAEATVPPTPAAPVA